MQYYIYSLFCFLLPGTVWLICNRRMIADKAYKVRHIIWIYIYMFYGYLAVQEAAGIGTIWDLITYGKLDNSINLIPFSSEGAMTYNLNIIMFMPLGFLLPLIWKNFIKAVLCSGHPESRREIFTIRIPLKFRRIQNALLFWEETEHCFRLPEIWCTKTFRFWVLIWDIWDFWQRLTNSLCTAHWIS